MKRATKIAIGVAAALSLGLAAVTVGAHPTGNGPGGGMAGMGMMGGGGMGMMGGGPAMMGGAQGYGIEERLARQKSALKITPDQESAWQTYAGAAKKQADRHDKLVTERHEQLEAVRGAYKDLYTVLTPEQRAGFDSGFHGLGAR